MNARPGLDAGHDRLAKLPALDHAVTAPHWPPVERRALRLSACRSSLRAISAERFCAALDPSAAARQLTLARSRGSREAMYLRVDFTKTSADTRSRPRLFKCPR